MVPTHARMLSLASYRATASFLDSYQPRIQIQPRPLYSLLNISDILRPAMVRVRRVTVLICGSVCSRLPASHPHGLKSYKNNHFRISLTLFSFRSTKKTFYWLLKWLESRYERFLDRFSSPCVVVVVACQGGGNIFMALPRHRSTLWCTARRCEART